MKKSYVILAAVPAICAIAGYGAGTFMKGDAAPPATAETHEAAITKTEAEKVLDRIADEAPDHPAPKHNPPAHAAPAHPARNDKHREYEANVVPAALNADDGHAASGHSSAKDHAVAEAAKHGSAAKVPHKKAPAESHPIAKPQHAHVNAEPAREIIGDAVNPRPTDAHVVPLGRMTVPVYKASSVTYVVADFGVAVSSTAEANHYELAENSARLRDAILTTMHKVAGSPMLKGPSINSDHLAEKMTADLKKDFGGVEDVLLLSLYKTDIPRG